MQTTLATLQPETPFPGVLYLVALWRRRLAKKGKEIRKPMKIGSYNVFGIGTVV